MSTITFDLLDDNTQIECRVFRDALDGINEGIVHRAWRESEYSDCHLLEGTITRSLASLGTPEDSDSSTAPDDSPLGESTEFDHSGANEPALRFVIGERRSAVATVEIALDRMSARMAIVTSEGGRHIEAPDVLDLLNRHLVMYGRDDRAIDDLMERAQNSPPGTKVAAKVARGKLPAAGVVSEFNTQITPIQERVLIPQERDDGTFDMRELGDIESVSKGDVLMERMSARPGEHGYDVTGEFLHSEAPKERPFDIGEGTEISPENPDLLIAARAGIAHRRGSRGISVDDVLLVQDVDLRVGNVHYEGSVYVRGDVLSRMSIEATGDVFINGFLEGGKIRCDGDVIVKNGIIGKPTSADTPSADAAARHCEVFARNITANYAQYAYLNADIQLSITSHITHCESHCKQLQVGYPGKRQSKLIGGQTHVHTQVQVGTAGSEAVTPTLVCFDAGLESLPEEVQAAETALKNKTELVLKLTETAMALQKIPAEKRNNEQFAKTVNTLKAIRGDVETLEQELELKQANLDEQKSKVRFRANNRVLPGVELRCFDAMYRFRTERPGAIYGVNETGWIVVDKSDAESA